MPNYLGKIVYLTEAQKEILFSQGSITVGTTTITYSADDLYITTDGVLPVSGGGTGLSSIGTAGQVLKVNSGATALEWGTASTVSTSVSNGILTIATS